METKLNLSRRSLLMGAGATAAAAGFPTLVLAQITSGQFELRAETTSHKLVEGDYAASDLWLYNGETPGPEIRVKQGETVRVRFVNNLPEPTSVHWHGIRIENSMDGVAGLTQDAVPPGGTFDYEFTVPDAGTFWYHAHNKSWNQVARGLYGPLIVEEPAPTFDRENDLTLVLDDWRLAENGTLHEASIGAFMDWSHAGRLGNLMTVNGQSAPRFSLNTGEAYRVRLINAANARIFQIDPAAMGAKLIGYDGFAFDKPRLPESTVLLGPAQRVDLLLQQQETGSVSMVNVGDHELERMSGAEPLPLVVFDFKGEKTRQLPIPTLSPNSIAEPDITNALKVPLVMTGGAMGRLGDISFNGQPLTRKAMMENQQVWAFNGVANMPESPLFETAIGQTVLVETINQTGWPHAMHVHGHHFRIISRNGKAVAHRDWRDTFFIDGNETVEIAFVADNPGKWMLHCHMLEHAAAGMRTWFKVA